MGEDSERQPAQALGSLLRVHVYSQIIKAKPFLLLPLFSESFEEKK